MGKFYMTPENPPESPRESGLLSSHFRGEGAPGPRAERALLRHRPAETRLGVRPKQPGCQGLPLGSLGAGVRGCGPSGPEGPAATAPGGPSQPWRARLTQGVVAGRAGTGPAPQGVGPRRQLTQGPGGGGSGGRPSHAGRVCAGGPTRGRDGKGKPS